MRPKGASLYIIFGTNGHPCRTIDLVLIILLQNQCGTLLYPWLKNIKNLLFSEFTAVKGLHKAN
jgi:hypothetical protein